MSSRRGGAARGQPLIVPSGSQAGSREIINAQEPIPRAERRLSVDPKPFMAMGKKGGLTLQQQAFWPPLHRPLSNIRHNPLGRTQELNLSHA